jgi:hypothetical protein
VKAAPLYVDASRLCGWVLERVGGREDALARRLSATALDLLEHLTLALKNRSREERIESADEDLIALRVQLRLAGATGLLSEAQMLFALEQSDGIGRQLGGWRRSLGAL